MPTTKKRNTISNQVYQQMKKILPQNPQGLKAKELKEQIFQVLGGKPHTIGSNMSKLVDKYPNEFGKTQIKGEGKWYFSKYSQKDSSEIDTKTKQSSGTGRKEEDFYEPFAKYLKSSDDDNASLSECTKAIPLGGNVFGDLWSTPDVIGLYEPKRGDVIKFSTEVVSAEIKLDDSKQALMTAFAQACSYRLFSHKTYLVVPAKDVVRLKKLCRVLGIGLVFFDPKAESLDTSIFTTELLAQKYEPDMSYVNDYLKQIAEKFE